MSDTSEPKPGTPVAKIEITIAVLMTLTAALLHVLFLTHAGGLWRDEANVVQLATLPHLGEVWQMLTLDSCPALYVMLLRAWSAVGFGASDFGLRCLGFLTGLSLLGALWWNARTLGFRTPMISLGLLACSLTVVRWGDSLRAYGTGGALMVLCVSQVWAFIRQPTALRFAMASAVAVLSVQCLYQNAFLLAALCVAASLVCFRRRKQKAAWLALAIGLPAALSFLPYLRPLQEAQAWFILVKTGFNARLGWRTLNVSLDTPPFLGQWVWIILVVTAVVIGLVSLRKRAAREAGISEDLPLFGALAAVGGIIGFLFYLYSAGLPTQPWYWLPLMTFLAVCVEAVFGQWLARQRGWTLAIVATFVAASFVTSLGQVRCRQTNIDRVAARLQEVAEPDDLVIVYPWFCGISFHRYYHGPAPWTTIPELEDHRLHRYDQLKVKMQEPKPIQPLLEKIRTTLTAGGKVWLVGRLPGPKPGETAPPELPPAPNGPWGWYDPPYDYSWGRQVEHFIRTNARQMEVIPISGTNGYTRYENVQLAVVTGSSSPN